MAIFGRKAARQRLRRATRESLTIPTFSSPVDCTPWVIGGLWPAELSTASAETATLAEYLNADLRRIASSANDELRIIRRAGMADLARQEEEARVINEARGRAEGRVESTVRQLRTATAGGRVQPPRHAVREFAAATDIDKTQVIPALRVVEVPEIVEDREVVPVEREDQSGPAMAERAETPEPPKAPQATAPVESGAERLRRLVAFVARQEPRLNWAAGDYEDGTTVLVTDLAHGWVPAGIKLPAGVRLLEPGRRTGRASALIGDAPRAATYSPGDPLGWSIDFAATQPSVQPRELPAVDDLGWQLIQATHWRDGVPRIVHTLAKAAATGVVDDEVDLLRVHLDTARYRLLDQYPDVDPGLLLNCLLMAATEGIVTGDLVSANYHFSWFQKLDAPPASGWAANP
ncbi:DUF5631 domain-containing protein [Mycobacterium sp.]|uniref:DUF5631 domain-containing protein n=1 Tax=Mycobacterium sp. TaxID=1785 RepID=UPI003F9CCC43